MGMFPVLGFFIIGTLSGKRSMSRNANTWNVSSHYKFNNEMCELKCLKYLTEFATI